MASTELHPGLVRSLWIYQRERFPLMTNALLVACLTASAVCYSSFVHDVALPEFGSMLAGYITVLLTFLLIRLLDEFKDADDDAAHRPERPVPRGLVSLEQLAVLGSGVIVMQLVLQWLFLPHLFALLGVIYVCLALMTVEFGVGRWLQRHPMVYAVSHMLIMPVTGVYLIGINGAFQDALTTKIFGYLLLLFVTGFVVEVGRKIKAPESERFGVVTYSGQYGPSGAVALWLINVLAGSLFALWLLWDMASFGVFAIGLGLGVLGASRVALGYLNHRREVDGKRIEAVSGIWCVLLLVCIAGATVVDRLMEMM